MPDLNIDDFNTKPPNYICVSTPFIYSPVGHVITGDFNIINSITLRDRFVANKAITETMVHVVRLKV